MSGIRVRHAGAAGGDRTGRPAAGGCSAAGHPGVIGELVGRNVIGRTGFGIVDTADPTFDVAGQHRFRAGHVRRGHARSRPRHVPAGGHAEGHAAGVVVGAVAACSVCAGARLRHRPRRAVRGADGVVVRGAGAARDRRPEARRPACALGQGADRHRRCRVHHPAAVGDRPGAGTRAALGVLAIAACAGVLFFVLRHFERNGTRKRCTSTPKRRGLALELRISLILLFGLSALASHPRVDHAGRLRARAWSSAASANRTPGPSTVWHHRGLLLARVLRLARRVAARRRAGTSARSSSPSAWHSVSVRSAHCAGTADGQPLALARAASAQLGRPVAAATVGTKAAAVARGGVGLILGALITVAVGAVRPAAARHPGG